ncbi:MAG: hypothetical protein OSB09_07335 [Planctomycetota bacterium]|nr:hypothetical protein [Planctomycetota bacterium]
MLHLRTPKLSVIGFVAATTAIFNYCLHLTDRSLGDLAMTSGWFLLGSFLLLCLYGIRKKLPFLPLGKTSTWLMFHLAIGFLSAYFFLEHTDYRLPTGAFEILLWIGFTVLIVSGISGWILMRTIPHPLRESMHLLPDRIQTEVATLIDSADAQIIHSPSNSEYQKAYLSILRPFLFSRPGFFPRGSKQGHFLPADLIHRYSRHINISQIEPNSVNGKIHQMVLRKSELDRQLRLHLWMRGWLLIHLPITGVMVILISLHVLVVHVFAAGSAL